MDLYDENLRDGPLALRVWRNEVEGWLALGAAAGTEGAFETESVGKLVCAWWRIRDEWMSNLVLSYAATPNDLAPSLDAIADRMNESPHSTMLRLLAPGDLDAWQSVAREHGFHERNPEPMMVVELSSLKQIRRSVPEITVECVENEQDHNTAIEIMRGVYHDPPRLTEFFSPAGAVHVYLARWDGQPAATATLWPFAGVAGVYSVATLPEYRRHGLASAAIEALLVEARARGFELAFLRTLYDLIPLYERLGFRFVGNLHTFRHARPIPKALRKYRDE